MSSSKVLPLKLKEPRGLVVLLAYIALSSALELAVVYHTFIVPGLEDIRLIGPLGLWTGLIPALVASVLVLSLLHLTRSFYVSPKKPKPRAVGGKRRRRPRPLHGMSRALRPLRVVGEKLASRLGALGLAVVRGLSTVLLWLCAAIMFVFLIVYFPELFGLSGWLVRNVGLFSWLVWAITGLARELASGALRWLADGLVWASIELSQSLRPLWTGIANADPTFKYAAAQNIIAWAAGASALLYRRPLVRGR